MALSQKRQAGESELTPEMIEAGADELLLYDADHDNPNLRVRLIFEAMIAAQDGRGPRSP